MTRANYSSEVRRPRGRLIGPGRVVDKGDEVSCNEAGYWVRTLFSHIYQRWRSFSSRGGLSLVNSRPFAIFPSSRSLSLTAGLSAVS